MKASKRLVNQCTLGDVILVGQSRKSPSTWTKACLIDQGYVLHSIKTDRGCQVVKQHLTDFLEHEGKPLGLFRLREDLIVAERPKLMRYVLKHLQLPWWNTVFRKGPFSIDRNNKFDLTQLLLEFCKAQDVSELDKLGMFVRLL